MNNKHDDFNYFKLSEIDFGFGKPKIEMIFQEHKKIDFGFNKPKIETVFQGLNENLNSSKIDYNVEFTKAFFTIYQDILDNIQQGKNFIVTEIYFPNEMWEKDADKDCEEFVATGFKDYLNLINKNMKYHVMITGHSGKKTPTHKSAMFCIGFNKIS